MKKIIGNAVGVPNPQSDWNQTDKTKADYIKNKPEIFNEDGTLHLTKEHVGLGFVDNTPDIEKPLSVTQSLALDNLYNVLHEEMEKHTQDFNNPHGMTADKIPTDPSGTTVLDELRGKASLSQINTFEEVNTFKSQTYFEGAAFFNYDTSVKGSDSTEYNIADELVKIKDLEDDVIEAQENIDSINATLAGSGMNVGGDLNLTNQNIYMGKTPDFEGGVGLYIGTGTELIVSPEGKLNVKGNDITENLAQLNGVVDELSYHLNHSGNPHNVTAEQVGAATKEEVENKSDALIFKPAKSKTIKLTDTKNIPLIDYKIYGNANGVSGDLDETTGKYMLPVTMYGKNLVKMTNTPDSYSGGTTLNDDNSITVGVGNGASTNLNIRSSNIYTAQMDNETVTASCKNISNNLYLAIAYKPYGKSTIYENIYSGQKTYTLTKGSTVRFFLQLKANTTISEPITLYPQLEYGSIATPYEKFVEPVTTYIPLPEPMAEGDYVDYANKKVVAQGIEYVDVDLPEIVTNYPSTSLICSGDMEITYKADTTNAYNNLKSELDTLKQAIISAGGNL